MLRLLLVLLSLWQETPAQDPAEEIIQNQAISDFQLAQWKQKPVAQLRERNVTIGELLAYVERHYAPELTQQLDSSYGYIEINSYQFDRWLDAYLDLQVIVPLAAKHGVVVSKEDVEKAANARAEMEKEQYIREKKLQPNVAAAIVSSLQKRILRNAGIQIERDMLCEKLIQAPSPEVMRKFFTQNALRYHGAVRAAQIFFSTLDPDTGKRLPLDIRRALKDKALELVNELKNGADFAELAKLKSDDVHSREQGGDLGYVTRNSHYPEILTRAMFDVAPGNIVGPLETELGFHILKIIDRKTGKQPEYKTVREQVEKDFRAQSKTLLLQELYQEAGVIIY